MKHKNLLSMKDFDTLHKAKKVTNRTQTSKDVLNELKITDGQDKDIRKQFPDYNRDKSYVEAEAGLDKGTTFYGAFLVKIHGKGWYKFEDGELIKKVK
jgi:hypothetical protein